MELAELKTHLDKLSPAARRQVALYLITQEEKFTNAAFRRKLTEMIDDKSPENWMTLEEAEKRLLQ